MSEKQCILGLESKLMERQNSHSLVNQMYCQVLVLANCSGFLLSDF